MAVTIGMLLVFFALAIGLAWPLGGFMARLFGGERVLLSPLLRPVERAIYRLTDVDEAVEMRWTTYAVALLFFNAGGLLLTYAVLRLQAFLPFNPQRLGAVEPRLAFSTAASFTSNTNWQAYAPETTMSYFSQMVGLAVHNFTSAATGIAIAVALIRGFARRSTREIGNFWVDLVRATLYLLLPICVVGTLVLVARGVPQNLAAYAPATTLAGATQLLPMGPVASQEIIKELGTNGGGFFNANSAHPFENPTPLTNLIELLAIIVIPAALVFTFGKMVGDIRQGRAIFAAMAILLVAGIVVTTLAEQSGNPLLSHAGTTQATSVDGLAAPGGNMEGKETRFGIAASSLWAVITTATSCGAVNAMHDSFTPLGGLIPLANIGLGEVVFGGVGSGLYGFLVFAVLAIFIAGLMVGRTPEYLGKKIEQFDVKMAMLTLLVLPLVILGFAAVAAVSGDALASRANPAAHGLSEIVYAFTSAAGNNGSAFAGLNANTPFYLLTQGVTMLIGRFFMIVPVLALAGNLAAKKRATATAGTFPTTGGLWVGLLVGVIVIVGALTYLPAYTLGPVIEQFQMRAGDVFALGS